MNAWQIAILALVSPITILVGAAGGLLAFTAARAWRRDTRMDDLAADALMGLAGCILMAVCGACVFLIRIMIGVAA